MFSLFREKYDQNPFIENYNKILQAYSVLFPRDVKNKKYIPLDDGGVCSGLGTEWVSLSLSNNSKQTLNYFFSKIEEIGTYSESDIKTMISKLVTVSESEMKDMREQMGTASDVDIKISILKERKNEIEELLDFGLKMQTIHAGADFSSNFESKRFRDMMHATWLYSTPLIKQPNINDEFKLLIKPNHAYRFYSKKHVITAITDEKQMKIYDPNGGGEVVISLKDPLKALNHLQKRFGVVDHLFESVSVFTPAFWNDPILNPPDFSAIMSIIKGNPLQFETSIGLIHVIGFLEEDLKKLPAGSRDDIENAIGSVKKIMSEILTGARPVNHVLTDLVTKLNELKSIISGKPELTKYSNDLNGFISLLSIYKTHHVEYDIQMIVRGINSKSRQLLMNSNNNAIDPYLERIISYTEDYDAGTKPLAEIIYYLNQNLVVLSNEFGLENEFKQYTDYFENFIKNADFMKTKQKIHDSMTAAFYHSKDKRNNLFVAVELGDTQTINTMLASNYASSIDLNKPVNNLTFLQVAITINHPDIVKILLAHKADACFIDQAKDCLLQYDHSVRNPEIAIALLEKGAINQLYHVGGMDKTFMDSLFENYSGQIKTTNSEKSAREIIAYLLSHYPDKVSLSSKKAFLLEAIKQGDERLLLLFVQLLPNIKSSAPSNDLVALLYRMMPYCKTETNIGIFDKLFSDTAAADFAAMLRPPELMMLLEQLGPRCGNSKVFGLFSRLLSKTDGLLPECDKEIVFNLFNSVVSLIKSQDMKISRDDFGLLIHAAVSAGSPKLISLLREYESQIVASEPSKLSIFANNNKNVKQSTTNPTVIKDSQTGLKK